MRFNGQIGDMHVSISPHAATRICEMEMQPHEVELTLTAPDKTFESTKYPGDICYTRGRFTLATRMDGETLIVKTALYSRLSEWIAADRDGHLGEGRALRTDTGIPS